MAGCSVVTLGALFGLYRPVRAGVFGFLLIIYAGRALGCSELVQTTAHAFS